MERRPREVEDLVIGSAFWLGRRVFVTGHTGFKGSWLTLMLARLNARATGYALAPPTRPSLFALAKAADHIEDQRGDVRDLDAVTRAMSAAAPEIVIHMAAQPLVRASYADPIGTYATNVMGTAHVLEAARRVESVRLVLVVTTDKCYENRDWLWGYRETDALGGHDPYSNSKACAELVTAAYRDSFCRAKDICVVSARAGNVIGGGDFAADRILPDALRAFVAGRALKVRQPKAVRPWQHVLEPLSGYLALIERAFSATPDARLDGGFNFGPGPESERSVEDLLTHFISAWGAPAIWERDGDDHPHEARLLRLDTAKARELVHWTPLLDFQQAAQWTAHWYRAFVDGADMADVTQQQIDRYLGSRVRLTSPFADDAKDKRHEQRSVAG
ncbi:CDP-glucose 4,6-dehydratase [Methylocystis echinoides]|uniref:CDP-glucose 4,6-dehydratase n=1 Tax=Methylocystis echinoides TaxID=29468 RepID=UPI00342C580F